MATAAILGRAEGRVQPQDLEAETSVLGAILLDQAAIMRVLDFLSPEDFYRENNAQIYRAALNLFREGEPIDNVTLASELEKLGVLERIGGRAHLALIQEAVPTAANVEHYARIVKDKAYKRRLITAGGQVTALGFDDSLDADEAVNQAQAHVYAISDDRVGSGMERLYDLLKPAMDRIDAQMASGGAVIGIPSGFHDIDRITNGFKAADLVIVAGRPSMGKALALDTPIPAPSSWTTMGSLRVGDQVFDELGRPCTVTLATPVMHGHECYEVEFSDGTAIVADEDHLWLTWDRAARREYDHHHPDGPPYPGDWPRWSPSRVSRERQSFRELRSSGTTGAAIGTVPDIREPAPITTRWLAGTLREQGEHNHAIPAAQPLEFPEVVLPLHPYVLGCLLGDGDAAESGLVACDPQDVDWLRDTLAGLGYETSPCDDDGHFYVRGIRRHWAALRLDDGEEIPKEYIRSSRQQRLALVQGMVDARGAVDAHGAYRFTSASQALVMGFVEVARSLGLVPRIRQRSRLGEPSETAYEVILPSSTPLAQLPRKQRQARDSWGPEQISRYVVDVRPVRSVPVRCIQVDSPSHLYLAGRGCVPTHNTSFALNVALHAAVDHKKAVAIFSLEMSKEQLVERMLCEQARIDAQRLHRGTLSDVEYERLAGALGPLGDAPIFIDDAPMLDDLTMRLKTRQARSREGIELVVLDYLQLMHGRSRGDDSNRVQEVSAISRGLKSIARELSIPVIAISQLSRAPEARPDRRPILSDLRESGSIEQDADVVMFLYRDEYYNRDKSEKPGIAEVILAKHRNGPTGMVELVFRKELTRFENLERRRPEAAGPDA